ncbi:MAG: ATP-binding cassette domain-containing protein [Kiritimatiellae bacterium]|nr:ATP-binding cassette domain-containing protein [Kiritimatiellia bacterium]
MALLSMQGISLSFGAGLLLDNIDLNIEPGDRACLVGRNGAGKSSLLKILHGDLQQDSGEIQASNNTRISYLPQDVPVDMTGSVEKIATSWVIDHSRSNTNWDSYHVVGRILSHLSLDPNAEFEKLSGGQKRRVLLARALICEPDLLLLDEPTNHLDINSICWLEDFLLRHCKTFLFVTHDRAFLRRIANKIIDLDRGQLAHWSCDYDTFLRRKTDLIYDEQVRQKIFDKKLSKEEVWIRQGIKARRTRDEGRVRQLMQMREERQARRTIEGTAKLQVQHAERSGNKVIETKALSFSYNQETHIIKDLSTKIMRGDKIGIIGPNGSGKTTLLKLFTNELQPKSGELILGTKLETAYFDQHRAVLDNERTVAENAGRGMDNITIDGKARHIISYLKDFLFTPERAKTPVKVLSGGERNRLLLAMLFARPSNLLIMDEPTNDLDTETLELLEEQLLNYKGTTLMVSHDRAFLDNVVTSILAMEGNGIVSEYIGSYQDYINVLKEQKPAAKSDRKKISHKISLKKQFGFNENRELNALPKKIEKLETKQASLHATMASPDYYKTDPEQIAGNTEKSDALLEELNKTYSRWEELEILREQQ